MPLISGVPCDIMQILSEVLSKVKAVDSKLIKIETEHELLKDQLKIIDSKLDSERSDISLLRMEVAEINRNVAACNGSKILEILRNEAADTLRLKKETATTLRLKKETADTFRNVESENMIEFFQGDAKIQKEVGEFNRTGDWLTLRSRLNVLLNQRKLAYDQILSIQPPESHPLWHIGFEGHTELASLLVNAGLPAETMTKFGDSMLHGAADGGRLELVKLLLCCGADVNARGRSTNTPLITAAVRGHLEVVKLLVSSGADTCLETEAGHTARQCAEMYHHTDVVQFLDPDSLL